jgi:hypothetical protein
MALTQYVTDPFQSLQKYQLPATVTGFFLEGKVRGIMYCISVCTNVYVAENVDSN